MEGERGGGYLKIFSVWYWDFFSYYVILIFFLLILLLRYNGKGKGEKGEKERKRERESWQRVDICERECISII